jgi:DNA-binding NarL/FixJ family response regulator
MSSNKIFTYVSPKSSQSAADTLCAQLPIVLKPIGSIEELFPLLSDPAYHTDYVAVCIDSIKKISQGLDMFSVLITLDTLIRSTVRRVNGVLKPIKRDTKIVFLVPEDVEITLLKQALNFPYIYAVALVLENENQIPHYIEYIQKLTAGEVTHDSRVLELAKPKKKSAEKKTDAIILTARQSQVLQLVQDRGASNKTIARMLNLSESTVKLHMGAIFKKYGVKSRTQLAVFARDQLKSTAD